MSELPLLALTLWQPWGSLMLLDGDDRKDVENRPWAPSPKLLRVGSRFWIHAGAKMDKGSSFYAALSVSRDSFDPAACPLGALLGHVRLEHVSTGGMLERRSRWFVGPVGWYVADPVRLREPIPCKGALGLWRVPAPVLEIAREQMGRAA